MKLSEAELLIFDLDGTVADTLEGLAAGVRLALAECGYPPRDDDHVRRSIGNGPLMLCRRALPDDLYDDSEAAARLLTSFRRAYEQTCLMTKSPYDGMTEVLLELRRKGYRLALLSNKMDNLVGKMIDRIFPAGLFDRAWGTTSDRKGKPDPAGALDLCRELGVDPSRAVMIGDGETDYRVSVAAGLGGHVMVTWGFRPRASLEEAGASVFVNTPAELGELFK